MINKILQPLVSVCIPVFNGENFLKNCINSILEQDYDNFEILIVDNCSTDSTQSIIVSYEDNRIRKILKGLAFDGSFIFLCNISKFNFINCVFYIRPYSN